MGVIVALDQSYACTGVALIRDGEPVQWEAISFPSQEVSRTISKAQKRFYLTSQLCTFMRIHTDFKVDLLVIEELWGPIGVSLSTGLIDYAYDLRIRIKALNTKQWKKAMLGHPNGSKGKAVEIAQLATGQEIADHNIADSICIGLCAHRHPKLLKNPE